MIYALIITIYMSGGTAGYGESPVAVSQSSTVGFTTEQSCKNAGEVARAGRPNFPDKRSAIITYQCAALNI
ncbi:hypothetical protein D3C85_832440 [compost metagenome]